MRRLETVAAAIWLGAWIGVVGSLVLAIVEGDVPGCVPHLTGCTSVSSTGRHGWSYFTFKAFMLPVAGLSAVYWTLCHQWLRGLTAAAGGSVAARADFDRWMLLLGTIGAAFLAMYVTFLGATGDEHADAYRALRRYGTVVYFGFTYVAQLMLTHRLRELTVAPRATALKLVIGVFMLAEGLLLAALANLVEDDDALENLSEWHFTTALTGYFGITWWIWRRWSPPGDRSSA